MLDAANHIMGEPVAPELAIHLLDRARASAGGAPRADAVIAIADAWEQEGHLALAREAVLRRLAVMAASAPDARSAFLRYDVHHTACTLALATGDLLEARTHAEALAALLFLREERHIGHAHLVAVRTLSGDPDAAVASAEIFERDWIRAGRPVASNLAMAAYGVDLVQARRLRFGRPRTTGSQRSYRRPSLSPLGRRSAARHDPRGARVGRAPREGWHGGRPRRLTHQGASACAPS